MYNAGSIPLGLGQVTPGEPGFVGPVKPSTIDSVFANLEKGLQVGLSVYDKVREIQNLVKLRKQAQETAKIVSQLPPRPASTPAQVVQPQSVNWASWALIGGGALVLILLLRK
jgi:hypothetical protein